MDNPHLKPSGWSILVLDLLHYMLIGQSLLHHQQISQTGAQPIFYELFYMDWIKNRQEVNSKIVNFVSDFTLSQLPILVLLNLNLLFVGSTWSSWRFNENLWVSVKYFQITLKSFIYHKYNANIYQLRIAFSSVTTFANTESFTYNIQHKYGYNRSYRWNFTI